MGTRAHMHGPETCKDARSSRALLPFPACSSLTMADNDCFNSSFFGLRLTQS